MPHGGPEGTPHTFGTQRERRQSDPNSMWGKFKSFLGFGDEEDTAVGGAIGGGGAIVPASRALQDQAIGRLRGGLESGRTGLLGTYDEAIRTRQAANAEAIRQMRMGIAAPAAGTLAGSGAAGLLASGAAQAGGRQAALTAGLERDRMLQAGAEQEANILQQRAAQQLGFAQKDLEAFGGRMKDHLNLMEQKRATDPLKNDYVNWLRAQRDQFGPGSPEWELYNNEMQAQGRNVAFSG